MVAATANEYAGMEDSLFKTLVRKYGPEPPPVALNAGLPPGWTCVENEAVCSREEPHPPPHPSPSASPPASHSTSFHPPHTQTNNQTRLPTQGHVFYVHASGGKQWPKPVEGDPPPPQEPPPDHLPQQHFPRGRSMSPPPPFAGPTDTPGGGGGGGGTPHRSLAHHTPHSSWATPRAARASGRWDGGSSVLPVSTAPFQPPARQTGVNCALLVFCSAAGPADLEVATLFSPAAPAPPPPPHSGVAASGAAVAARLAAAAEQVGYGQVVVLGGGVGGVAAATRSNVLRGVEWLACGGGGGDFRGSLLLYVSGSGASGACVTEDGLSLSGADVTNVLSSHGPKDPAEAAGASLTCVFDLAPAAALFLESPPFALQLTNLERGSTVLSKPLRRESALEALAVPLPITVVASTEGTLPRHSLTEALVAFVRGSPANALPCFPAALGERVSEGGRVERYTRLLEALRSHVGTGGSSVLAVSETAAVGRRHAGEEAVSDGFGRDAPSTAEPAMSRRSSGVQPVAAVASATPVDGSDAQQSQPPPSQASIVKAAVPIRHYASSSAQPQPPNEQLAAQRRLSPLRRRQQQQQPHKSLEESLAGGEWGVPQQEPPVQGAPSPVQVPNGVSTLQEILSQAMSHIAPTPSGRIPSEPKQSTHEPLTEPTMRPDSLQVSDEASGQQLPLFDQAKLQAGGALQQPWDVRSEHPSTAASSRNNPRPTPHASAPHRSSAGAPEPRSQPASGPLLSVSQHPSASAAPGQGPLQHAASAQVQPFASHHHQPVQGTQSAPPDAHYHAAPAAPQSFASQPDSGSFRPDHQAVSTQMTPHPSQQQHPHADAAQQFPSAQPHGRVSPTHQAASTQMTPHPSTAHPHTDAAQQYPSAAPGGPLQHAASAQVQPFASHHAQPLQGTQSAPPGAHGPPHLRHSTGGPQTEPPQTHQAVSTQMTPHSSQQGHPHADAAQQYPSAAPGQGPLQHAASAQVQPFASHHHQPVQGTQSAPPDAHYHAAPAAPQSFASKPDSGSFRPDHQAVSTQMTPHPSQQQHPHADAAQQFPSAQPHSGSFLQTQTVYTMDELASVSGLSSVASEAAHPPEAAGSTPAASIPRLNMASLARPAPLASPEGPPLSARSTARPPLPSPRPQSPRPQQGHALQHAASAQVVPQASHHGQPQHPGSAPPQTFAQAPASQVMSALGQPDSVLDTPSQAYERAPVSHGGPASVSTVGQIPLQASASAAVLPQTSPRHSVPALQMSAAQPYASQPTSPLGQPASSFGRPASPLGLQLQHAASAQVLPQSSYHGQPQHPGSAPPQTFAQAPASQVMSALGQPDSVQQPQSPGQQGLPLQHAASAQVLPQASYHGQPQHPGSAPPQTFAQAPASQVMSALGQPDSVHQPPSPGQQGLPLQHAASAQVLPQASHHGQPQHPGSAPPQTFAQTPDSMLQLSASTVGQEIPPQYATSAQVLPQSSYHGQPQHPGSAPPQTFAQAPASQVMSALGQPDSVQQPQSPGQQGLPLQHAASAQMLPQSSYHGQPQHPGSAPPQTFAQAPASQVMSALGQPDSVQQPPSPGQQGLPLQHAASAQVLPQASHHGQPQHPGSAPPQTFAQAPASQVMSAIGQPDSVQQRQPPSPGQQGLPLQHAASAQVLPQASHHGQPQHPGSAPPQTFAQAPASQVISALGQPDSVHQPPSPGQQGLPLQHAASAQMLQHSHHGQPQHPGSAPPQTFAQAPASQVMSALGQPDSVQQPQSPGQQGLPLQHAASAQMLPQASHHGQPQHPGSAPPQTFAQPPASQVMSVIAPQSTQPSTALTSIHQPPAQHGYPVQAAASAQLLPQASHHGQPQHPGSAPPQTFAQAPASQVMSAIGQPDSVQQAPSQQGLPPQHAPSVQDAQASQHPGPAVPQTYAQSPASQVMSTLGPPESSVQPSSSPGGSQSAMHLLSAATVVPLHSQVQPQVQPSYHEQQQPDSAAQGPRPLQHAASAQPPPQQQQASHHDAPQHAGSAPPGGGAAAGGTGDPLSMLAKLHASAQRGTSGGTGGGAPSRQSSLSLSGPYPFGQAGGTLRHSTGSPPAGGNDEPAQPVAPQGTPEAAAAQPESSRGGSASQPVSQMSSQAERHAQTLPMRGARPASAASAYSEPATMDEPLQELDTTQIVDGGGGPYNMASGDASLRGYPLAPKNTEMPTSPVWSARSGRVGSPRAGVVPAAMHSAVQQQQQQQVPQVPGQSGTEGAQLQISATVVETPSESTTGAHDFVRKAAHLEQLEHMVADLEAGNAPPDDVLMGVLQMLDKKKTSTPGRPVEGPGQ